MEEFLKEEPGRTPHAEGSPCSVCGIKLVILVAAVVVAIYDVPCTAVAAAVPPLY